MGSKYECCHSKERKDLTVISPMSIARTSIGAFFIVGLIFLTYLIYASCYFAAFGFGFCVIFAGLLFWSNQHTIEGLVDWTESLSLFSKKRCNCSDIESESLNCLLKKLCEKKAELKKKYSPIHIHLPENLDCRNLKILTQKDKVKYCLCDQGKPKCNKKGKKITINLESSKSNIKDRCPEIQFENELDVIPIRESQQNNCKSGLVNYIINELQTIRDCQLNKCSCISGICESRKKQNETLSFLTSSAVNHSGQGNDFYNKLLDFIKEYEKNDVSCADVKNGVDRLLADGDFQKLKFPVAECGLGLKWYLTLDRAEKENSSSESFHKKKISIHEPDMDGEYYGGSYSPEPHYSQSYYPKHRSEHNYRTETGDEDDEEPRRHKRKKHKHRDSERSQHGSRHSRRKEKGKPGPRSRSEKSHKSSKHRRKKRRFF